MRALLSLYKKHIPLLIVVALLYALAAICSLLMPYEMGVIVTKGIKAQNQEVIIQSGIIMSALALSALLISLFTVKINAYVAAEAEKDFRVKIFKKINSYTFEEFSSIGTSSLLTRANDDVANLSYLASSGVYAMVNVPITFIGGVILVMSKDWLMGTVMLCASPLVLIFACAIAKRLDYLWDLGNKLTDEQNRHVRERLSGIRVLRAFDKEEQKHGKIESATKRMVLSYIRANVLSGFIDPVATILLNVATVVIIAVSANRISYQSALTAGDVISGVQYIGLILNGLLTLSWTITWLPQVGVSLKRIKEVIQKTGASYGEQQGNVLSGSIKVNNLNFTYPEAQTPALMNISLEIKEGESFALIGGTGSGKSTLVKLLLGFYPIESGEILLGGALYEPQNIKDIRASVSVALQKAMIFEGTLEENVTCFSNNYTREEVERALAISQLNGFLQEKGGLGFELKQYGANISGGQKQRINIARTILKPASVYIFDDSFSALDFLTESALRGELNRYLQNKTQIVITQRIATAMKCDKIAVLEKGEIVAVGSHLQLLNGCAIYQELYRSQLGGEL